MTHLSNLFNPIQKIIIENYQSHSRTELIPAGPGQLTVIVGQSRQGKTAIFRALRWLFYNSPDGTDFIRWGCTFARVTVEYADGTQVIRYRTSGGVNRYIIRKPNLTTGQKGQFEEQVYEGFGRGAVPLEVQQVTGVSPVEIGEGLTLNLNLAEQLDGPFLGNKAVSSTARAKVLGKLAGTEEVDLAGKQLGTDLFRWKRDKEAHEKAIRETETQLQGYEYLPGFKANLDRLTGVRDVVKADMERREKLVKLNREYYQVSYGLAKEESRMYQCQRLIKQLSADTAFIETWIEQAGETERLNSNWKSVSEAIIAIDDTLNKTQGLSQAEIILKATEGQFGRRQQAETIIARWNKMVWDMEQAEKLICNTESVLAADMLVNFTQKNITQLTSLIPVHNQHEVIITRIWKAEWTLDETEGVPMAESSLAELCKKVDRKSELGKLLGNWSTTNGYMRLIEMESRRTNGLGEAYFLSGKIQEDISLKHRLSNLHWENDSVKNNLGTANFWIKHFGEEVEKLESEYYETLMLAGRCPLCGTDGQAISQEKIKEII